MPSDPGADFTERDPQLRRFVVITGNDVGARTDRLRAMARPVQTVRGNHCVVTAPLLRFLYVADHLVALNRIGLLSILGNTGKMRRIQQSVMFLPVDR